MTAPARTPEERELEKLQKKVTEGDIARKRLEAAAFRMWTEHGMTQREVHARLDRADRSAGGEGLRLDRVEKMLARRRRRDEAESEA